MGNAVSELVWLKTMKGTPVVQLWYGPPFVGCGSADLVLHRIEIQDGEERLSLDELATRYPLPPWITVNEEPPPLWLQADTEVLLRLALQADISPVTRGIWYHAIYLLKAAQDDGCNNFMRRTQPGRCRREAYDLTLHYRRLKTLLAQFKCIACGS
jgi:hypothetical protein